VDAHRHQAGRGVARDRRVDLEGLLQRPDQEHPVGRDAGPLPGDVEHPARGVAQQQHVGEAAEQRHAERQTGHVDLGGEGDERDDRDHRPRRPDDTLELVGAGAQVAPVIGALAPEHGDPAERQQQPGDDHEERMVGLEAGVGLGERRRRGEVAQGDRHEVEHDEQQRVAAVPGRRAAGALPRRPRYAVGTSRRYPMIGKDFEAVELTHR
jgi:hypothetical protein